MAGKRKLKRNLKSADNRNQDRTCEGNMALGYSVVRKYLNKRWNSDHR
jgi:hypothetical protein